MIKGKLFLQRILFAAATAAVAYSATLTIGPTTYNETTSESVTAPFTLAAGTPTVHSYSGLVLVTVSGTGESEGTAVNDAFYFVPGATTDPQFYHLGITNGASLSLNTPASASNFIVYDAGTASVVTPPHIPAYSATNTYTFVINTALLSGGGGSHPLFFGVIDGIYSDNSGQYIVTVTQLVPGDIYISDGLNQRIREDALGTIVTVAGNGTAGFSGDGGPATSAELHSGFAAFGVTLDSSGNIFIADSVNNRIREVSTSGVITTVAGNGTAGFSGDGGAATGAELNNPTGVAVDGSGTFYIADQRNNRIRKVSGGVITTVAGNGVSGFSGDGGPATSAAIYYPNAVALDNSGNLYIADTLNNRIRKVSGGTITTIAGNATTGYKCTNGVATSLGLNEPRGVAVDSGGNVFIADYGLSCIREVTGTSITTVAGNGSFSYGGDGGPATSAALNDPTGVAVDNVGDIYIADYVNNRIRMVNGSGIISTVAGNGTPGFNGDGHAATATELYNPVNVAVPPPPL